MKMLSMSLAQPKPIKGRQPLRKIVLMAILFAVCPIVVVPSSIFAESEDAGNVWGNITYYTDSYVVVNGKQYNFDKAVTIDTYSLKPDKRGNVRLRLDSYGAVLQLFFYGIDMPEVISRFKR